MLFKISNILATENATKTTKTTLGKIGIFGKSRYFYISCRTGSVLKVR